MNYYLTWPKGGAKSALKKSQKHNCQKRNEQISRCLRDADFCASRRLRAATVVPIKSVRRVTTSFPD